MRSKKFGKIYFKCWEKYIDKSIVTLIDSKTKLQEYSLKKFKKLPKYTFLKKLVLQHKPNLKLKLKYLSQKRLLEKEHQKNAQQNAAEKLIRILKI